MTSQGIVGEDWCRTSLLCRSFNSRLYNYRFNRCNEMVGMFGCGDSNAEWLPLAKIDLNGKELDWKRTWLEKFK